MANTKEMTQEEARVWLRKVLGPPRRLIEGVEKEHLLTLFNLIDPVGSSDNQISFTEEYVHAGKHYDATYFYGEVIVEEILEDDI